MTPAQRLIAAADLLDKRETRDDPDAHWITFEHLAAWLRDQAKNPDDPEAIAIADLLLAGAS
jgi:hypothetical protein